MKFLDTKYFGVKLSPHRIKNDKGQLIITGCTFARTGKQRYHKSELGIEYGPGEDEFINLDRPVEEVSSPATIASFEASPITDDHPEDDVIVGINWHYLAKGMSFNIKFVFDSDKEGHLEADLILTDPKLIDDVDNHRVNELSAGYNCDVDETTWTQRKIRGNHIAVVSSARAGHMAVIRDKKFGKETKMNTVKVGDKVYSIVDSYTYDVPNEDGNYESYTDFMAYNEDGIKQVVKTVKVSDVKKPAGYIYLEKSKYPGHISDIREQLGKIGLRTSHSKFGYLQIDTNITHLEEIERWLKKHHPGAKIVTEIKEEEK